MSGLPVALVRTKILKEVYQHIKKYDQPGQREKKNYVSCIVEETGWSRPSVYKCLDIFESMGLIERKSNGQKKVIHLTNDVELEELE